MSWTWAGFWMDDPVFRYKQGDFFQSGRHKDINPQPIGNTDKPKFLKKSHKKTEPIDEEDMKKIKELEDKKKEVERLWNDLRIKGWKRKEQARNLKPNDLWEREDDSVSNYVCSVCSTHGDDVQKRV